MLMRPISLAWKKYTAEQLNAALSECFCLYVFHHPADGDRPYYIGKAKYFGTHQSTGYKASARYNGGYTYLIEGMLRSGFSLYVATIGEKAFDKSEAFEQELIALWKPIRQKRIKKNRSPVETVKPWLY